MISGTSLVVQWLGLRASTAGDTGSIPGWGTKIPHASCPIPPPKKEREVISEKVFTLSYESEDQGCSLHAVSVTSSKFFPLCGLSFLLCRIQRLDLIS